MIIEDHRPSAKEIEAACDPNEYRVWNNVTVPSDFPLPLSKDLMIYYTVDLPIEEFIMLVVGVVQLICDHFISETV